MSLESYQIEHRMEMASSSDEAFACINALCSWNIEDPGLILISQAAASSATTVNQARLSGHLNAGTLRTMRSPHRRVYRASDRLSPKGISRQCRLGRTPLHVFGNVCQAADCVSRLSTWTLTHAAATKLAPLLRNARTTTVDRKQASKTMHEYDGLIPAERAA